MVFFAFLNNYFDIYKNSCIRFMNIRIIICCMSMFLTVVENLFSAIKKKERKIEDKNFDSIFNLDDKLQFSV